MILDWGWRKMGRVQRVHTRLMINLRIAFGGVYVV